MPEGRRLQQLGSASMEYQLGECGQNFCVYITLPQILDSPLNYTMQQFMHLLPLTALNFHNRLVNCALG